LLFSVKKKRASTTIGRQKKYLGLKAIALVLPKSSAETGIDIAETKKAPEVDD
jgi:hypothetical protein